MELTEIEKKAVAKKLADHNKELKKELQDMKKRREFEQKWYDAIGAPHFQGESK